MSFLMRVGRALAGRHNRRHLLTAGAVIGGSNLVAVDDALGRRRKNRKPTINRDARCLNNAAAVGLPANDGDRRFAHVFEARRSGKLIRASLGVIKAEGSTGAWVVRIAPVDVEGVPTDAVLAEVTIPNGRVPVGRTLLTAAFSPAPRVRESKEYALIVTRPGSDDLNPLNRENNPCGGRLYSSPPEGGTVRTDVNPAGSGVRHLGQGVGDRLPGGLT